MDEEQKRSEIVAINGTILRDKRLTPTQKLVYARIAYFEEYFESSETAAEFLGLTTFAVQKAKRALEQLGYIRCVGNTGRGKRYVSDLQSGLSESQAQSWQNARPCESQTQTLQNANSELANRKLRVGESQDINKNINKNEIRLNSKEKINKKEKFVKPSLDEVKEAVLNQNLNVDPEYFYDYYESNGWKISRTPMKDWKATLRNWHRRNSTNGRATTRAITKANQDDQPYEPEPTEEIGPWRDFFDQWQETLGMRPAQTVGNVRAAKQLVAENDPETVQALLVALALRSETGYLTKEIKNIATPMELYRNRERVWAFYQEHREEWAWKHGRGNKKPWEL